MPMIPAGKVTGAAEAAPVPAAAEPAPLLLEDRSFSVENPDGSIDNRATTTRWVGWVSELLEQPVDLKDPYFCAGVVIIAGMPLNYRWGQIAHFTGLPKPFCRQVVQNLSYCSLIRRRQLAGELRAAFDKPGDAETPLGFLFTLYCLAGIGRVRSDLEGHWRVTPKEDLWLHEVKEVSWFPRGAP